jgi:replicative DNA helicase
MNDEPMEPDALDDLECAVLAECILRPPTVRVAAAHITGSDFADPRRGRVFDLIVGRVGSGAEVAAHTIAMECQNRAKEWEAARKASPHKDPGPQWMSYAELSNLFGHPGCLAIKEAAAAIRGESIRRETVRASAETLQDARASHDTADLATRAIERFKVIRDGNRTTHLGSKTLGDVLDGPDDYDWLIPGLLESGDRLVVMGEEGLGKTVLMRQLAILSAAGIHPMTFQSIKPVRVAVVDCENTERQWRRNTRAMTSKARYAGSADPAETIRLECAPRMDITTAKDLGALHALLDEHDPQMLVIGPLYKLVPFAINNDSDAAPVITALDSLRDRGVCLLMEAHAGHAKGAGGSRDLRPRGSSALLGWPEFGFGLAWHQSIPNAAELIRWRGDRDERAWPEVLVRGGEWPWTNEKTMRFRNVNAEQDAS